MCIVLRSKHIWVTGINIGTSQKLKYLIASDSQRSNSSFGNKKIGNGQNLALDLGYGHLKGITHNKTYFFLMDLVKRETAWPRLMDSIESQYVVIEDFISPTIM